MKPSCSIYTGGYRHNTNQKYLPAFLSLSNNGKSKQRSHLLTRIVCGEDTHTALTGSYDDFKGQVYTNQNLDIFTPTRDILVLYRHTATYISTAFCQAQYEGSKNGKTQNSTSDQWLKVLKIRLLETTGVNTAGLLYT